MQWVVAVTLRVDQSLGAFQVGAITKAQIHEKIEFLTMHREHLALPLAELVY